MSQAASLSPSVRSDAIVVRGQRPAAPSLGTAFNEVLDAVNPLQQIPGVGQAYRGMTGDKISVGAQLAGKVVAGAAIAGPIGAAAGAGLFMLEQVVPSVFNFIGRIFSGGEGSTRPSATPQVKLPAGTADATAAASRPASAIAARLEPRSPLGAPAGVPAASPMARRVPDASSAQLNAAQDAMLSALFGATTATSAAPETRRGRESRDGVPFVDRMSQALDKYQAMQTATRPR